MAQWDRVKDIVRTNIYDTNKLTDEQKKRATQAFDDLDKDGTGAVPNTKETVMEGAQLSGLNPTDQEVEKHMESVADAGETLDKEQFVALMEQFEWRSQDEIKESLRADFEFFDKDKSGVLEPSELVAIMTQYSATGVPEADVDELINNFDKDGDGNINIDELVDLLTATL